MVLSGNTLKCDEYQRPQFYFVFWFFLWILFILLEFLSLVLGYILVGKVLDWREQSLWSLLQHHRKLEIVAHAWIPALRRRRQEDLKYKVIFGTIVSSRSVSSTWEHLSKHHTNSPPQLKQPQRNRTKGKHQRRPGICTLVENLSGKASSPRLAFQFKETRSFVELLVGVYNHIWETEAGVLGVPLWQVQVQSLGSVRSCLKNEFFCVENKKKTLLGLHIYFQRLFLWP